MKISKKEIAKGNRTIAKFMGLKKVNWFAEEVWIELFAEPTEPLTKSNHVKFGRSLMLSELHYDSDWNKLISVCVKCRDNIIHRRQHKIQYAIVDMHRVAIREALVTLNIGNVWKSVVAFIKDYDKAKVRK